MPELCADIQGVEVIGTWMSTLNNKDVFADWRCPVMRPAPPEIRVLENLSCRDWMVPAMDAAAQGRRTGGQEPEAPRSGWDRVSLWHAGRLAG